VVKSWVFRGISNGILTTKYPRAKPTRDEIPQRSTPPSETLESDWIKGKNSCPTGAIQLQPENYIDLGKCIYCRNCESAGFMFQEEDTIGNKVLQARILSTESDDKRIIKKFEKKRKMFRKSLHILMIDVGSCNACNLEVLNLSNPYYDISRFGIFFTNSPKHADALVVVGALNKAMVDVLKNTYESMPEPKMVISIGACAISGGIFQDTESFVSPIRDVIPVDAVVPGCPPTPIQILEGLLLCTGNLEKQQYYNTQTEKYYKICHDVRGVK
jgi:Ni,Fe-hydrogenase III small subunit/ferredoxin